MDVFKHPQEWIKKLIHTAIEKAVPTKVGRQSPLYAKGKKQVRVDRRWSWGKEERELEAKVREKTESKSFYLDNWHGVSLATLSKEEEELEPKVVEALTELGEELNSGKPGTIKVGLNMGGTEFEIHKERALKVEVETKTKSKFLLFAADCGSGVAVLSVQDAPRLREVVSALREAGFKSTLRPRHHGVIKVTLQRCAESFLNDKEWEQTQVELQAKVKKATGSTSFSLETKGRVSTAVLPLEEAELLSKVEKLLIDAEQLKKHPQWEYEEIYEEIREAVPGQAS